VSVLCALFNEADPWPALASGFSKNVAAMSVKLAARVL
jgi:hypothetical protein